MSNKSPKETKSPLKMIGGLIPIELYWEFKEVQAKRKENAGMALERAIRLYLDIDKTEEADNNG